MTQGRALRIAAGLTAFVLVVLGAVFAGPVIAQAASPGDSGEAAAAQMQERDAAYRQMLEQANSQLQDAYDQLALLQAGTPTADPGSYPVSPDLAAGLALQLAPGAKILSGPTLVDFRGTVAYEIILDHGAIYIDATNARLLYMGVEETAHASMTSGTSTSSSGYHESEEHEDYEGSSGYED